MPYRKNMARAKTDFARAMRRSPTPSEAILWEHLKGRRFNGLKFRRQAPMLGYIADFYCPSQRLVVELDSAHFHDPVADARRDEVMRSHRLTVVRIDSHLVHRDIDYVLWKISTHVRTV